MNILVTACYKVKSERYGDTSHEDYEEMTNLCVKSFKKNLSGLNKIIVLRGDVDSYHQVFKSIFGRIYALYKTGDCNILFVDSDTVCVKPVSIFYYYNNFRMFSQAEQFRTAFPSNVSRELYNDLSPWYLSNLRYYPMNLSKGIWDRAKDLYQKWIDVWAYECIIYNTMMHSQDIEFNNMPEMNYQYIDGQDHLNCGIKIEEASIIHCQSTRGSKVALGKMRRLIA